jgi:lactate dehydrogenase-like 2-hydroxyacid dehydrogenase
MPPELLAQAMRDVDAVIPCGARVSQEAIEGSPRLRVIANVGAGCDNIDLDACNRLGILVTNTPDVVTEATADVAFALLLASARRVVEGDRYVREGRWSHWQWNFLWGSETHGKTLGLYGFGRIGQAVARRGRGFSMRILYHARHRVSAQVEEELSAQLVDQETLLREADFLSVHVPLTAETRYSIGKPELDLMKPPERAKNDKEKALPILAWGGAVRPTICGPWVSIADSLYSPRRTSESPVSDSLNNDLKRR